MSSLATTKPLNRPCAALGHVWNWPSPAPEPLLTLECFVDYCCPFSARIFKRLTEDVIPHYNKTSEGPKIKLIFQQIPQPWHPQSATMHESYVTFPSPLPLFNKRSQTFLTRFFFLLSCSVCAVRHLYGIKFTNEWQTLLMAHREEFVDALCQDESRNQISSRLAKLAATIEGIEEEAVMDRMSVNVTENAKNSGSASIRVLKFYVKQHRQLGIHVSPTTRINNMIVETSSGWTLSEWNCFLDPMLQLASNGYKRN
jgi:hypothetical protein